jgi:predicted ATPase
VIGERLAIRRVGEYPGDPMRRDQWPATLQPVRQILNEGLELGAATVFVGENGTGKSTIVEAIAVAFGLSAEGGSTGADLHTRRSESELWRHLSLARAPGGSHRGFFLRAETMHGFFTYLERNPGARPEPRFHEMSHGESFLEVVVNRFRGHGLWVLDEPESALSFSGCLALLGALQQLLADGGSQVILSTHSPVLARLAGARILEVGDWGLRDSAWEDLDVVSNWKLFLDAPERFLRHLN